MKRFIGLFLLLTFQAALLTAIPPAFKRELNEINKKIAAARSGIPSQTSTVEAGDIDALEKELRAFAAKIGFDERDPDIARSMKGIEDCRKELDKRAARQASTAEAGAGRQALQAAAAEDRRKSDEADRQRAARQNEAAAAEQRGKDAEYAPLSDLLKIKKDELLLLSDMVKRMRQAKDDEEFINLLYDGNVIIPRAKDLLAKFIEPGLDLRKFERTDALAQSIGAARILFDLEDDLKRLDGKLDTLRRTLINLAYGENESIKAYQKIELINRAYEKILKYFEISERLFPGDSATAEMKRKILPEAKNRLDGFAAKTAEARMAKERFEGAGAAEIRGEMKKLYEHKYPSDRVLRVVILSPGWEGQARATVDNDGKISAGYYQYLYAQVAVKKADGALVFNVGYRRQWTGSGDSYGPLAFHSVGSNYPILEANVNK